MPSPAAGGAGQAGSTSPRRLLCARPAGPGRPRSPRLCERARGRVGGNGRSLLCKVGRSHRQSARGPGSGPGGARPSVALSGEQPDGRARARAPLSQPRAAPPRRPREAEAQAPKAFASPLGLARRAPACSLWPLKLSRVPFVWRGGGGGYQESGLPEGTALGLRLLSPLSGWHGGGGLPERAGCRLSSF